MKIFVAFVLAVAGLGITSNGQQLSLTVHTGQITRAISAGIYGQFLEHIFNSVRGGLWGNQILNDTLEVQPGARGGSGPAAPTYNSTVKFTKPLSAGAVLVTSTAQNTLSEQEKKNGWRLLWDGNSTEGWRSATSNDFPKRGWAIKDGELIVGATGNAESQGGGDIITKERYSNFELVVDFKTSSGCNSGIKYLVQPDIPPISPTGVRQTLGSAIGPEFQILDDANHPDAKAGRNGTRTLGSLYDLIPAATTKKPSPIGQWNTARIIVKGSHVEHWLNGGKILEYERGSPAFKELVAKSKFNVIPGFGEWPDGHILLQEHGSRVAFRNIKIRVLTEK